MLVALRRDNSTSLIDWTFWVAARPQHSRALLALLMCSLLGHSGPSPSEPTLLGS